MSGGIAGQRRKRRRKACVVARGGRLDCGDRRLLEHTETGQTRRLADGDGAGAGVVYQDTKAAGIRLCGICEKLSMILVARSLMCLVIIMGYAIVCITVNYNALSTFQDTDIGHRMSLSQLCELWHFDMLMANTLLDLPLRKCSAIPEDDSNFPPMDSASFKALKSRIGRMWINASHLFECCKTDERGWGLFVSKDYNKNERILTVGKPVPLGWIAKAPGPNNATFHRYLRSPCIRGADSSLYLGGPISLANYDCTDMLTCRQGQHI
ncbi:DNA damage-inducible transcript 3 protein [Frankliniella fusca]|uniref:DNA damage-inducible transcript 3 protein n=1 Tax=Frankliniella fusca TaxID=407009 RepID=A0AAE1LJK7_9NEOP|nr:DNA damage-inducible transcript 3 protein [Frankliniella fusca]